MFRLHLGGEGIDVRLRLFARDAGFHSRNQAEVMRASAIVAEVVSGKGYRLPELRLGVGELKTCGHHADDGVALAIEHDAAPDDLVIAGELALPETVAEYRDLIVTGLIFCIEKDPPAPRRRRQRREEAGCNERHIDAFRLACAGQVATERGIRSDGGERLIAVAVINELRRRGIELLQTVSRQLAPNHAELLGVRIR